MATASYGTPQGKTLYRTYRLLVRLVAALILISAALSAAAQQAAPIEFSQEQLVAFAAAAQRVQELNQKWLTQIGQADSDVENAQMREQAMEEMKDAVHQEGLTVEEYNQIYDAAQRDPAVMRQIEEHGQSLQ